jgi:hypothetical protein
MTMSKQIQEQIARGNARIVEAPVKIGHNVPVVDRSFGLPKQLYGLTVAGYLGFLAIMAAAFMNPVLVIPMAIFALFIAAGFGVPAIFTRLKGNDSKPLSLGEFSNEGIMTLTGRLAPRDAAIQVLILPALIVAWGGAVAIIAAVVA